MMATVRVALYLESLFNPLGRMEKISIAFHVHCINIQREIYCILAGTAFHVLQFLNPRILGRKKLQRLTLAKF